MSRSLSGYSKTAPNASSGVSRCGLSGGSTALNGCVALARSPGTSLAGTGRSSTGNTRSPVSRCRTNSCPVFVVCRTTGISRPSFRRVTSAGGDAKANEYGGMNALARYPRARECGEKVNVAPRLMLDPVDERLGMMVDQVSKGATSEGREAGAR